MPIEAPCAWDTPDKAPQDDEASLPEKQAHSKLLDRVAKFSRIERSGAEDTTKVIRMMNHPYYAPMRASINLALPWHDSATLAWFCYRSSYNTITGKLSKSLKKLNQQNLGA